MLLDRLQRTGVSVHLLNYGCLRRWLSVSETAIALRPLFFMVHPDLFGKFPKEQVITASCQLNCNNSSRSRKSLSRIAGLIESHKDHLQVTVNGFDSGWTWALQSNECL